jgi:hypothetical protein
VSLNTVTRYRQELGLKAVLAVKQVNDALEKHPHPEIFNTDQGAQCTSEVNGLSSHRRWVLAQTPW